MAVTQNTYTGNGATVLYSFTFPYLETTDVKVTINGTPTTAYTFANATTIQFNTAPANGAAIRIYRDTDDASLAATFYSGSAIRAQDLNDNFTQNLYVTQETNNNSLNVDGSNPMVGPLNMNGFQITNLPVPAVDTNAATKKYVDDRFGNLDIPGHTRWRKVATASQTIFSGTGDYGGVLAYSPTREQVYINGALQQRGVDYAADNGTSVVFTVGLTVGDVVDIICVNNLTNSAVSNAGNITYSGQFSGQTARTVAAKLGDVVSVLDFGADPTGQNDSTAAIQAAIQAGGRVLFPKGTYCCNIVVTSLDGVTLEGANAALYGNDGSRLVPYDNTKPVIDVVGPVVSCTVKNFVLDSKADSTFSHIGIGLRIAATNPDFVWRSRFSNLFIRGFQDGLVIDCDINISEVFDCDFSDLECLGISRYSFKLRGVYHRFSKLFATQVGVIGGPQPTADYALYHDGSNCYFDIVTSSGRQYWGGTGNFVGNAIIEAIDGPGVGLPGYPAMELSGTQYNTWLKVRLNGVPTSKYPVGVRIAGTNHTIGDIIIEGPNYPATGLLFAGGSSGIIGNCGQAGALASWTPNWTILGAASSAISGIQKAEFGASEVVFNNSAANYDFRVEGANTPNLLTVDASANSIGVNTGTPLARLHVKDGTTGGSAYPLSSAIIEGGTYGYLDLRSTGSGGINFGDASQAQAGFITYNHSNDSLALGTANSNKLKLSSIGLLNLAYAPTHADNAAALAAGLTAGDVYRTATGQLMITY